MSHVEVPVPPFETESAELRVREFAVKVVSVVEPAVRVPSDAV